MQFSTTNGSFSTTYEYDSAITEPTEIYLNKAIWYSNGYKTVASTDNGEALSSVTWQTKDSENYMQVVIGDEENQALDGQNINILLTPTVTAEKLSGICQEDSIIVDWTITDAGTTSLCNFDVAWDDNVDKDIELYFINKDGSSLHKFTKS